MRYIKFALAVILCLPALVFCACFSLGVADMTEYNSRFTNVHAIEWNFSCTTTAMSEFVGDDGAASSSTSDSTSSEEKDYSELTAVVASKAYRAIAVQTGDDYTSSTISEFCVYFYYQGTTEVQLTYGVFVASDPPQDNESYYTMSDISGGQSGLYEDGAVVSALSADNMLATGTLALSYAGDGRDNDGWSSIYQKLDTAVTISSGQYFIMVFFENNDYVVSVEEVTEDDPNTSGGTITTYNYTFAQNTANDISFSFDKVLLYVTDAATSSSSG